MKISKSVKIKLFREMLRIRLIEQTIASKYHEAEMRCPVHLSVGQEALAVGVCQNLKKNDKIVTAHRSHAHYLAKGGSVKKMLGELYGKVTGCAKGLGGSMHLIDLNAGVFAAVPIVGSTIPIGTGIAWANKLKKKEIVAAFFWRWSHRRGLFESLDFASLHNLPILFVCENNEYSVYSHISKRQSSKRSITKIAKSFGIESLQIDGNNIEDVFLKTKKIINKVKSKPKPFLIELKTFRHLEHCGPNNDDKLNYRTNKYLNLWKKKCPIINYQHHLKKYNYLTTKEIEKMKMKIRVEIFNAFNFAKKSNFPKKILLKKYIYA